MKTKNEIAISVLGFCGRMISFSKSTYCLKNPKNLVVFNANICTKNEKIWFGDIDITKDKKMLFELSRELQEDVYILYEMDARFYNEDKPLIDRHVVCFTANGNMIIGSSYKFLLEDNKYDL